MKRNSTATIALCLAALSLSACAGVSGQGAAESPRPSVSASASTSQKPVNTTDPATWIVSETGVGPFQLGANWKSVTASVPNGSPAPTECPNPNAKFFTVGDIDIASFLDEAGKIVGVSAGNPLYTPNASTDGVKVPSPGPHTAEGISFGSTVAEFSAAYPSLERIQYSGDTDFPLYTEKTASGSWMTFSVDVLSQTTDSIGVWPGTVPPAEYCG